MDKCVRNNYQGQGQVITPHNICRIQLFVLDTYFRYTSPQLQPSAVHGISNAVNDVYRFSKQFCRLDVS